MIDLPAELLARARMLTRIADTGRMEDVADLVTPWLERDIASAAQVMVVLALMADEDKLLRAAHAAYNRGDRTDVVVDLERVYQQQRQANNRQYKALRQRRGEGAA